MKQDEFIKKLERRLEENKRIAESSWIPGFLKPLASYLAFNAFRTLFVLSLILTILMSMSMFEQMMWWGRKIFLVE